MRYIHQIFTIPLGDQWENAAVLAGFEPAVERLPLPEEERGRLRDFVRFQLVGERRRRAVVEDWASPLTFQQRAELFDSGANRALDALAAQIAPAAEDAGITWDAILTTTATGNLMPGLSYRLAHRLGGLVRPDTLMLDLGNVGCTGSSKALLMARHLGPELRHLLIAAVEIPSTLVDVTGTTPDVWQGNCTFGDGAAAVWVSGEPDHGPLALALEEISYRQRADTGLDLIRWGYRGYYGFSLADEKTFDREVREHVVSSLGEAESGWKEEPRWAIHPAGILLLVRLSRRLGIPAEAMRPSTSHYREHSNMSSVSLLHLLKEVGGAAPAGAAVNLLTMGAGFNVIYGRVRRVR